MATKREFPEHLIQSVAEKLNCSFVMACIELQESILKNPFTGDKDQYQAIENTKRKYLDKNPLY